MAVWIKSEDVRAGARLLWKLPSFLRHPVSLREAREELRRRRENREQDFLRLLKRAVYARPHSPYRQLLRMIGCEWEDLQKLVRKNGVESALEALFQQGVYLTVEEFKGRRPITRGSSTLWTQPGAFVNPEMRFHMAHRSSGSGGPSSLVPVDLASLRDRAINTLLGLEARKGSGWFHAIWIVPGGSGLSPLLQYAALGIPTRRWFSQIDPQEPSVHPRYAWSIRAVRLGGRLGGFSFPSPLHAPLHDPGPIIEWLVEVRSRGHTPHLQTFPSSAVQLCQFASEKGLDLQGVQFSIVGEPITAARLEMIQQTGATAVPHYGSVESGRIGDGCLAPEFPDECHRFDDLNALIQAGSTRNDAKLPPRALLVSSLRPAASLILLNVSMGDQAVLRSRACGCPLQSNGWTGQLHTIRSHEKLTAAGMTFIDADLVQVLEESLPRRFGGTPTDYQLLETEDAGGRPRLSLLVHPALRNIDPHLVESFFLSALGAGSEAARVMALFWRDSNLLKVIRATPVAASSGKVLHVSRAASPGTTVREAP